MWEMIKSAMQAFWNWLVTELFTFGDKAIQWILSCLPVDANGAVTSGWNTISFAIQAANAWVPIDLVINLTFIFVTFVITHLALKVVVKLIP
jgi:hypothetical protein